ncbi:MAG: pyrroline-5-carboxylate reductase, partial [Clostridiales bacterium]|nr:pyrroline-5-carboxylate reductase [Clostridiales bacterium]
MKIGFIGTGNMGTAILEGYIMANPGSEKAIFAYDRDRERLKSVSEKAGIQACDSIATLVGKSDILLLAVKPDTFGKVLHEIAPAMDWEKKIIVSIAAGITLNYIVEQCRENSGVASGEENFRCKVVRVMPNTPALIGKGMSALTRNAWVSDEEMEVVMRIFRGIGKAEQVDEKLMDCVVGVSGSSPAYVYIFIEAMADGAVALGMNRKQAYAFAAQAVAGSAEMVLQTGLHPGELKDRVCSPGGATIEAVEALEQNGFRSAVIDAVRAAAEKSAQMTK